MDKAFSVDMGKCRRRLMKQPKPRALEAFALSGHEAGERHPLEVLEDKVVVSP